MASPNSVTTLEVFQVTPSSDCSPQSQSESATEFSLPLTFFDTFWFKFPPVERIFFYRLPESTTSLFNSVILPRLTHSLSLTLLHFLPLAGSLTCLPHASVPVILYTPNDGVSLTVAESNAEFNHLSGDKIREAADSRPYIPELSVSESRASAIALQITLFPNQGFCIVMSSHHAILDGKSVILFIKAWAQVCKETQSVKPFVSLSPDLSPFYDRTLIQDPQGIAIEYLNNWFESKWPGLNGNPRSLKLLPVLRPAHGLLRATFNLSREDIKKIRERVISQLYKAPQENPYEAKAIHLSTFVLTFAYTIVCLVKAKGLQSDGTVRVIFTADCRARLDPPIPSNYFGNCVLSTPVFVKAEALMQEEGIAFAAQRLSELITGLEKGALEGAKEKHKTLFDLSGIDQEAIGVAGSPRFGVYQVDFGWGRPEKVEVTSIEKTRGISMAESKDGSGGVEVGIVLEKLHMDKFHSLFVNGLVDS